MPHDGDQIDECVPAPGGHLLRLQRLVKPPEAVGRVVEADRRVPQRVAKLLDVAVAEPGPVRLAVQDPERLDLVLVVFDEPLEVVQLRAGALDRRLAVPEVEQHVDGRFVDDLVQALVDLDDRLPEPRLGERLERLGHAFALHGVQLFEGRIVVLAKPVLLDSRVVGEMRVDAVEQRPGQRRQAQSVRLHRDPRRLRVVHPLAQPRQTRRETRHQVRVRHPHRGALKQLLQAGRWLSLQRRRHRLVALADADRIDDHKMGLVLRVRGDLPQVAGLDDTHAPALHLFEVAGRVHVSHEQQAFERLHVGAGRDHVHRDRDARMVGVAEAAQQVLRRSARRLRGDLPAELVALAELLLEDLHDVVGVAVVLREHERLGNFLAAGEDLREQMVAEGARDEPDLVRRDNVAVELVRRIGEVGLKLRVRRFAGPPVAFGHVRAGFG